MTQTPTRSNDLVTLMLFLIDPRTDEEAAVTSIEALDEETAKEVLTMISSWTAGVLDVNAENKGVPVGAVMQIIGTSLRETADRLDRIDHEGGLFT
jgi:hypothetical protein